MTMIQEADLAPPAKHKRAYKPRSLPRLSYASPGIPYPRGLDARTAQARKFKAYVRGYVAEIGGELSDADRDRIANAALIAMQIERLQQAIVMGGDVNVDAIVRLNSEHRRLLTGLRARAAKAKPAGPSIEDLFAVDAEDGDE